MNRNVVHQSSPVQQMMATGGPNWWNCNNMRPASSPPFPPQHSSPFLVHPPPGMILPQHVSSWNDNQEFPDQSWSQLLMGGITNGEDKSGGLSHMQEQDKKLEIWEEQLLQQQASNGSNSSSIKQENSTNNYHLYASTTSHGYNINAEFGQTNSAAAKPSYSQLLNNIPPVISSPTISCVTSLSSNMLDFSNNKVDGKHPPPDRSSDQCNSTGAGGVAKKARVHPSSSTQSSNTFKVRKEKLGDRITTLHQLVSPFGKTDTASVLLEALGYIRFLQSQIEALSLPYLGNGRSGNNMRQQQSETNIEEGKKDLRSKGLCLVPISCTIQVGSDNGADYWAPAAAAFGGSF